MCDLKTARFVAKVSLFLSLIPISASGQVPTLVKDIKPGPSGSNPIAFQDWNGELFFVAGTLAEGREPWISDGTAAGTRILRDIAPGPISSFSKYEPLPVPVEFQGNFYFVAGTQAEGLEVWRSDGTTAGTQLLRDIEPGPGSSRPELIRYENQLFIVATTTSFGKELWTTDGTSAGTQLFVDLWTGPGHGIEDVVVRDDVLFISGNDGSTGYEPWICSGTPASLQLLKDIAFGAADGITIASSFAWNGEIFFRGYESSTGHEIYATDKTPAGTRLIADFNPGLKSTSPQFYGAVALNNGVLFQARDEVAGFEPWITDGTAGGTFRLGDFYAGIGTSLHRAFGLGPDKAVFTCLSSTYGFEPFITDGTIAGTQVVDLDPGPTPVLNQREHMFATAGGKAYFPARGPGTDWEIGVSDGTVAGTKLTKDLLAAPTTMFGYLLPVDDFVFFGLGDTGGFFDVPRTGYSDGTDQGTQWLPQDSSQISMNTAFDALRIGETIFFSGSDAMPGAQVGFELWSMPIDIDGDGEMTFFDDFNVRYSCKCGPSVATCGNSDANAGCVSSLASGATLTATGSTLLGNDDLVMTTSNVPAGVMGLMFMGTNQSAPSPLGDGLLCLSGSLQRWGIQSAGPNGTFVYGPGLAAQAQANFPSNFHFEPGLEWNFQTWYRDPNGPCGQGSNLSDMASVVFTP